jgi:hypothetical protein
MQAQMQELKEQARAAQRQAEIAAQIHQHVHINPIKEIVREIHQPVPIHVPVPQVIQDNSPQMIQALHEAVAQNKSMGQIAIQLGMSMEQLFAFMKNQVRQA